MLEFVSPQVRCEEGFEDYGKFVVEPLESGFGITMGNALRRVLLGALPGAAVTAVRIEGVQHEFGTIPHIKEDVIEFLLNVKELRLKPFSTQAGRLQLEVEGEGMVCAGDIKPSTDFEVVNPELHLATLDSAEAKLNVEFYVEMGQGYVPASRSDGLPLGVIPVDTIFTPLRRVNYTVEKTRVGQVSNYDRLILEVWTDGSISPIEALSQAAQILVDRFQPLSELDKMPVEGEKPLPPSISLEQYEISLEQLGLSARTLNALRRSGITKVGELLEKQEEELLGLRSFGQKSLQEVMERLAALDLLPKVTEEGIELPEAEAEAEAEVSTEAEAEAETEAEVSTEPEEAEEEEEREEQE